MPNDEQPLIVVTRPAAQAQPLMDEIAARGWPAVAIPAIAIEPIVDDPRGDYLARLKQFDLIHFASANAIEQSLGRWSVGRAAFKTDAVFAVMGPGSQAVLRRFIGADEARIVSPLDATAAAPELDTEHLWQALDAYAPWAGRQALLLQGEGGRDLLAGLLERAGAQVERWPLYRRCRPIIDAAIEQAFERCARATRPSIVVMSSAEGLEHFVAMAATRPRWRTWLANATWVVTHARIGDHAARLGHRRIVQAPPGHEALMRTIESLVSR